MEYTRVPFIVKKRKEISATFIYSAAGYGDFKASRTSEFCVLGRSNVGKSSFINHVFNNSRLARVSNRPGKTSLANFYALSNDTAWIDMPGYGYAKTGREDKRRWSRLIADYCHKRDNCKGALLLFDIRHPGLAADQQALEWLATLEIPVFYILTKSDKLSKNQGHKQVAQFRALLGAEMDGVAYSIMDQHCREHFWDLFLRWSEEVSV
ncbi:MAG: ribosome biogenesis GTP-binding protein YsxC [Chitinivibrionales bacterium]|nr:ribosome biogenesis GTP-binding protein YsxC [Chitinivibrionales bacterium]